MPINFFTSTEAAELAECSTRTIGNRIKQGIISASKDDKGNYLIDKSEFFRVFPQHSHKVRQENMEKSAEIIPRHEEIELKMSHEVLKAKYEAEQEKNSLLTSQISDMNRTFNQAFSLLENKSEPEPEPIPRRKFLGIF
jgi:hypothetical protein